MKLIIGFLFVFFFISCGTGSISYDKFFYEKVTGIKVPDSFKVLESFDNAEYLTGTTFGTDSLSIRRLVIKNCFSKVKKGGFPGLIDLERGYIKGNMPDKDHIEQLYFISKTVGKNSWVYIADLKKGMLWTEITYPDWGGN